VVVTPDGAYRFTAEVWLHQGEAAWHFLTVPGDVSDDIEARTADQRRGFGSVRVDVTVGATTWSTSVFPDTAREAYVLPVKKEVRRAERIDAGDRVEVRLAVADA
jgi:hypothetical protein